MVNERTIVFFKRHQTISAFLVFACLAAYAMGANPFAGQTVAPFDLLMAYPGWSEIRTDRDVLNTQPSDIVDGLLPVWAALKEQIRAGKGALWNPYGSGGEPISLEIGNPAFLLFLLVRDNALAFYLVGLAKLVISGFGGYLLLRVFFRWLPAVWGGMVYMLCGFNTAWFFWDQVTTAMWIPWLLWATVMYLKTDHPNWLPAIAITSLLMIFGGFPAVAAFGFYSFGLLILIWVLYDLFEARRDAGGHAVTPGHYAIKAGLPLLAVGAAFLTASMTLIPFVDTMRQFNLGYRTGGGTSFDSIRDLLLFFTWETPLKVERTAYIGLLAFFFVPAGMYSAFRVSDRGLKRFIPYAAVLVAVSLLITFGLLPDRVIRAIPVFNSNHWSRLIVIPLLGLAVLSSAGLDAVLSFLPPRLARLLKLTPVLSQRTVMVAAVLVLAVQFQQQKDFFNAYNAIVPSAWFYPPTPGITYVKERLKPLQSVITDNSYMIGGTLGAYGIPEWFAHAFRTDREKEVLSGLVVDPFASPTAAYIQPGNIRYDSPLMDKLVIRYLLVNRNSLEGRRVLSSPVLTHDLAPPLPDNAWRQHLSLSNDLTVGAFGFLFSTSGKEQAPAPVRLTLFNDRGERYGPELQLGRNDIADNQWSFFEYPSRVPLRKGAYILVLSLAADPGSARLSAATTATGGATGDYLEVNGRGTGTSLQLKIGVYERGPLDDLSKKWIIAAPEEEILVLENRNVTGSAYFIDTLDPANDRISFSGMEVRQPSSDLIEIEYVRDGAGWIVLPMHLHPGWKAYVDERPAPYDAYLQMLPAIPVPGACRIAFRYEPASVRTGAAFSSLGVAMGAALWWFARRKQKQEDTRSDREKEGM